MDDKGMKNPVSGKDQGGSQVPFGERGRPWIRVVRGGSHDPFNLHPDDSKTDVKIASRYLEDNTIGDEVTGFRVARTRRR